VLITVLTFWSELTILLNIWKLQQKRGQKFLAYHQKHQRLAENNSSNNKNSFQVKYIFSSFFGGKKY